GGKEAEGGDDHLVTRPQIESAQGEDQRVGAVGEPDAGRHTQVGGEGLLELPHLGAEAERGLVEDPPPALAELRGDAPPGTAEIQDGNVHRGGFYPVSRRRWRVQGVS